jgi:5-methylcytosine-specific restriction endonuclease McrA
MKIAGIDLLDFGNKYQINAVVFNSDEDSQLLLLPGEDLDSLGDVHNLSLEDWQTLIQQTDLLEIEVGGPLDKVKKALVRKTQRQIEQAVSWFVYKRDNYSCRYCGNDSIPLTVDHLVLWENGGPSIVENLVSSCKKCNRTRGNMEYAEWLESDYYKKVATKLSKSTILDNWNLAATLPGIQRVKVMKKR